MEKTKLIIDKLESIIKTGSVSRMQTATKQTGLQLQEGEFPQLMPGEWVSLILLSTNQFRILFKVFFDLNSVQLFIPNKSSEEKFTNNDVALIKDLMNEYCNLAAGYVKAILEKLNINTGMSLPLVLKGFDDFYFPFADDKNSFEKQWTIHCKNYNFYCASYIEVLETSKVEQLISADLSELHVEEGDVDFL